MSVVVDYAWGRPGSEALKAVNASGVARYLSWLPNSKVIDRVEYGSLRAAGIDVVLVWEYRATDFIDSSFDAYAAACEAIRQAELLGYDGAIYYAIDWDITVSQWNLVKGRLNRGPIRAHGVERTGIYGPWNVLEWAKRDGVANWFWQAGMSTAWSNGKNRQLWPDAHLRQVRQQTIDGVECDINEIIQSDYGQNGVSQMVQITGPDPWGTGDVNEQAMQLRNGYHLMLNGYQPDNAIPNGNGLIARLSRLESGLAEIKAALTTLTSPSLTPEQLESLATSLAARLEGTEQQAVASALREVLGSLDVTNKME